MIMCHKNFDQVYRLAKRCMSESTRVIIHVDEKVHGIDSEICAIFTMRGGGGYLTRRRISGFVDDRSLVDITMLLIERAHQIEKEENIHFDYFCLLSGQDYLTKPIEYINEQLLECYPSPFIDCCEYDPSTWIYKKFVRNPFGQKLNKWLRFKVKMRSPIWYAFKGVEIVHRKAFEILKLTDYHYFKRKKIDLYGGSAWWILPDKIVDYITVEYNANRREWNRLLESVTPEEVFFQTLAKQSPLADMIEINPKNSSLQICKTWSYFYDDDKPPVNHPYTFTTQEYDKLVNRSCWFARKFDLDVDTEILDMLDRHSEEVRNGLNANR